MKKSLFLLLIALSIPFAMTACSNKEEAKNNQSEMVRTTEESVVLSEEEMS